MNQQANDNCYSVHGKLTTNHTHIFHLNNFPSNQEENSKWSIPASIKSKQHYKTKQKFCPPSIMFVFLRKNAEFHCQDAPLQEQFKNLTLQLLTIQPGLNHSSECFWWVQWIQHLVRISRCLLEMNSRWNEFSQGNEFSLEFKCNIKARLANPVTVVPV